MYGCDLYIAGSIDETFHAGLEAALLQGGMRVVERIDHTYEVFTRYRWFKRDPHEPWNLSYFEMPGDPDRGPLVEVVQRVYRHPRWNFQLARALSALTGGFGIVKVNDRLFDNYGRATFFAGRTLEALACSVIDLELVMGYGPDWITGVRTLIEQCDEEVNHLAFRALLDRLAGEERWYTPKETPVRSLILEPIVPHERLWEPGWGEVSPGLFGVRDRAGQPMTTAAPSPLDAPVCVAAFAGVDAAGFARALEVTPVRAEEGWRWWAGEVPPKDPWLDPENWSRLTSEEAEEEELEGAPYILLRREGGLDAPLLNALAERLGVQAAATVWEGPNRPVVWWSKAPGEPAVTGSSGGSSGFIETWERFAAGMGAKPWVMRWPPAPG